MSLVNAETGEIIAGCSPDEARRLTDQIKTAAESLWSLLLEAHDRQAWKALGYSTWSDYVGTEFQMSKRHANRLIDQAIVIKAIEEVGPTGLTIDLTERAARDVKPILKAVTSEIARRVDNMPEGTDDPELGEVQKIAAEVVAEARAKKKDDEEFKAFIDENTPEGFDAAADAELTRQRGELRRLCRDLAKLPDPRAFVADQTTYMPRLIEACAVADDAFVWLDEFLKIMEDHR